MLSPLDDRYAKKVSELNPIFSEFGLAKYRTQVELSWLHFLAEKKILPSNCTDAIKKAPKTLNFTEKEFKEIKKIEQTTNHDVKAVELFLQKKCEKILWPFIHITCTSEDINNLSYGLMLKDGKQIIQKNLEEILQDLKTKSLKYKATPMLCRTHGQTATPSTMGKELAVFYKRISELTDRIKQTEINGKINGATGTFSAHTAAYPDADWIKLSQEFVEKKLNLTWNGLTTQIEPHDAQAKLLQEIALLSSIKIDLCRDIWGYISLGYFGQKVIKNEVGSSTMPHKVNPIDFENAEGNLKLARGIARTLADELPISRWQRDLTDSTLQRNFGLVFGHLLLALKSLQKGLNKLELKEEILKKDLEQSPEVLTEAIQTVLRAHGHPDAYDQLKTFSRGKTLTMPELHKFINQTDLPEKTKTNLKKLTPSSYIGLAKKLVEKFVK